MQPAGAKVMNDREGKAAKTAGRHSQPEASFQPWRRGAGFSSMNQWSFVKERRAIDGLSGRARSCAWRASSMHEAMSSSLMLNLNGEPGLFRRRHMEAERRL